MHICCGRNVGIDEEDIEKLERDVVKAKQEKVCDYWRCSVVPISPW